MPPPKAAAGGSGPCRRRRAREEERRSPRARARSTAGSRALRDAARLRGCAAADPARRPGCVRHFASPSRCARSITSPTSVIDPVTTTARRPRRPPRPPGRGPPAARRATRVSTTTRPRRLVDDDRGELVRASARSDGGLVTRNVATAPERTDDARGRPCRRGPRRRDDVLGSGSTRRAPRPAPWRRAGCARRRRGSSARCRSSCRRPGEVAAGEPSDEDILVERPGPRRRGTTRRPRPRPRRSAPGGRRRAAGRGRRSGRRGRGTAMSWPPTATVDVDDAEARRPRRRRSTR